MVNRRKRALLSKKIRTLLSKKIFRVSFGLALALLVATSLFVYLNGKAAAWYNDNWAYRVQYTISGTADTNKKVLIEVDTAALITAGKIQSDCGDSRFTDSTGQVLRYYLDTAGGACNTSSTDYYVLVPTFYSTGTNIYHYYGNAGAANGTELSQFSEGTYTPSGTASNSEETGPGPVAYWKFDENTGTSANDTTEQTNTGTISGATWQTSDMCVMSNCLSFDGTNDTVTVSNTVAGIKSVSFWVKPLTTTESILALNGSASISITDGVISATGFTSPTIYVDGVPGDTLSATTWQQVTITTSSVISGSAITLGQVSSNYFQGFLDEVKLYPYVRSEAEIRTDAIDGASVSGSSAVFGQEDTRYLNNGLKGYWKMDESAANSCTGGTNDSCDSSGNSNDGSWSGNVTSTTTGKFGRGTTFDGTGDYIDVGDIDL